MILGDAHEGDGAQNQHQAQHEHQHGVEEVEDLARFLLRVAQRQNGPYGFLDGSGAVSFGAGGLSFMPSAQHQERAGSCREAAWRRPGP